jgi:hypothetical protein
MVPRQDPISWRITIYTQHIECQPAKLTVGGRRETRSASSPQAEVELGPDDNVANARPAPWQQVTEPLSTTYFRGEGPAPDETTLATRCWLAEA